MIILGIGGAAHDNSACLVRDGRVTVAIEEERITRKKHAIGLGMTLGRRYTQQCCLQVAGVTDDQVDLVGVDDFAYPLAFTYWGDRVRLVNHHLSHAASSYYVSGYQRAAVLVIDGRGSQHGELAETISYGWADGPDMELTERVLGLPDEKDPHFVVENSLGGFYSETTRLIGFGPLNDGKTMGLAPYGTDRYLAEMRRFVTLKERGRIEMTREQLNGLRELCEREIARSEGAFGTKADIAGAAQTVLEEAIMHCVLHARELTGETRLCLAGGVVLNGVANYKVLKAGIFQEIFVPPMPGDNGTSIGAALYTYHCHMTGGGR